MSSVNLPVFGRIETSFILLGICFVMLLIFLWLDNKKSRKRNRELRDTNNEIRYNLMLLNNGLAIQQALEKLNAAEAPSNDDTIASET